MTEIQLPTYDNKEFKAYVAMPEKTPAPALVVIQEIFGVNEEMRKKCDDFARLGFIAVCPDLFWRIEPGITLTDKTDEEWEKAFSCMKQFDVDQGVEDIRATEHTLKGHAEGNGKVGCVGYCLGGQLAYLTACRTNIHASVGYYGVMIDQHLDEAKDIGNPLMLHVAEEDEFVSKDAQKAMHEGLKDHDMVTLYTYPGVQHAFARDGGAHYDDESAKKANERTLGFLKDHLAA